MQKISARLRLSILITNYSCVWMAIILIGLSANACFKHSKPPPLLAETLFTAEEEKFSHFLLSTGLSSQFNLDHIEIFYPDSINPDTNQGIAVLYLRNKSDSKRGGENIAAYKTCSEKYEKTHGVALEEALFSEFVKIMNMAPENAKVYIEGACFSTKLFADDMGNIFVSHMICASAEIEFDVEVKDIRNYRNNNEAIINRIDEYIQSKYEKNNSKVDIDPIEKNDYKLKIIVKHIRNEVLERINYWEKLDFSIFLHKHRGVLTFTIMLEGWYGTGVINPPPYKGYASMEPEHGTELQDYLRRKRMEFIQAVKGESK